VGCPEVRVVLGFLDQVVKRGKKEKYFLIECLNKM
jgi:hypothetical protein